jgi:hypothetical protein
MAYSWQARARRLAVDVAWRNLMMRAPQVPVGGTNGCARHAPL